ncbi:Vegetative catalase [compost metagenome]
MIHGNNGGGSVYYEPNSFGGAAESPAHKPAAFEVSGQADSVSYNHDDHYTQPGDLYRLLSEEERARLVRNIVGAMTPVEKDEIKLRQIGHFYKADPEFGQRVAAGLGLTVPQDN